MLYSLTAFGGISQVSFHGEIYYTLFYILLLFRLDTGRKLNVHKTCLSRYSFGTYLEYLIWNNIYRLKLNLKFFYQSLVKNISHISENDSSLIKKPPKLRSAYEKYSNIYVLMNYIILIIYIKYILYILYIFILY